MISQLCNIYTHTHTHTYIYIYIYTPSYTFCVSVRRPATKNHSSATRKSSRRVTLTSQDFAFLDQTEQKMKALLGRVVVMWAPGDFWRPGGCSDVDMHQFWEEEYIFLWNLHVWIMFLQSFQLYHIYIYTCTYLFPWQSGYQSRELISPEVMRFRMGFPYPVLHQNQLLGCPYRNMAIRGLS